jgi:hypothetical protein
MVNDAGRPRPHRAYVLRSACDTLLHEAEQLGWWDEKTGRWNDDEMKRLGVDSLVCNMVEKQGLHLVRNRNEARHLKLTLKKIESGAVRLPKSVRRRLDYEELGPVFDLLRPPTKPMLVIFPE